MTIRQTSDPQTDDLEKRPVGKALIRGLVSRCPSCGETKLFAKALTVKDTCSHCHTDLYHHRADDLPAYLNIFVVGHIVVALTMVIMEMKILGLWQLVALSCISAVVLAIVLMRPLKGMVVGAQWALRMHGFGGDED